MRLLFVFCMFVLSLNIGFAQNTKNFSVECASLSNDGAVLITISKNRANSNYAPNKAIKDAITVVLKTGFPGSSSCVKQSPLLQTSDERDNFNSLSQEFYSSKGDWSKYGRIVERRDNVLVEGSAKKKREYVVSVLKEDLRKYLIEQEIINPLTKGF
jgi:hypothetical protein